MALHKNNGNCPHCKTLFEKYPNFNAQLRSWFVMFQAKYPEAHISCAGRGYADQEAAKKSKASRAFYGESAHNYNCAIDIFLIPARDEKEERKWFHEKLAPEVPYRLNWYGAPGSPFPELGHIQVREWRGLLAQGLCALVEEAPKKEDVA